MRNKNMLLSVLVILVLVAVGCSSSDGSGDTTTTSEGAASGAEVSVVNFRFEPGDVTVNVGDSVSWTNDSSARHTTTATDGSWNTELAAGQNIALSFDTAGTFEYFCSIHPAMTGTVTVNG